jgi:hypothetical protein
MPAVNREFDRFAEAVEAAELIVDERLERTKIEQLEPRSADARYAGDKGQECRLRFATRCGGDEDDVGGTFQQRGNGPFLDVVQLLPPLLPDPLANGWAQ